MMRKYLILLLFPVLFFSQDTISKPQYSVISLDKVKVVYRGIDNPISIAVSNSKSYTISGDGVVLKEGKYILKAGSGAATKIFVEIILLDDSKITEEHVFQIKNLPSLLTTINNQFSTQGYLEFSLDKLKQAEVSVKLVDFLFRYFPVVSEFTLKINEKDYINEGRIITDEVYNFIKKSKKNDIIIVTNVKWFFSGVTHLNKPSSSIIIKIVE